MTKSRFAGVLDEGWHPSEDDLLTFVDGGLESRKASRITLHLDECWSCRLKAEKVQESISSFVDYFDRVIAVNIAAPPQQWRTFLPKLRQLLAQSRRSRALSRWYHSLVKYVLTTPRHFRLTMAALIVSVGALLVIRFYPLSSVSASQLLQESVKARDERIRVAPRSVVYQRLRVRRKGTQPTESSLIWELWNDAGNNRSSQRVEDESGSRLIDPDATASLLPPVLQELEEVFKTNQMDGRSPLSPVSYRNWRNAIQRRSERVTERKLPGGDRALAVTTTASGPFSVNAILEAELTVRTEDWHPVEERLRVRRENGIVDYELGEVAFDVIALSALPPSLLSDTPLPIPPALPFGRLEPPHLPSHVRITAVTEVETWYALHSVRACLGRPITVVRSDVGRIAVEGVVGTEEHKAQILTTLKRIPNVVATIRTTEEDWAMRASETQQNSETTSPDADKIDLGSVPGRKLAIEDLLEHYFAARDCSNGEDDRHPCVQKRIAELSQTALADSAAALSQAWALRQLAQWYPSLKQNELRLSARRLLELMVSDHMSALKTAIDQSRTSVAPVLSALLNGSDIDAEASARTIVSPDDSDWPAASLRLCDSVEHSMSLALSLFSETNSPVNGRETTVMQELMSAFADLDRQLQQLETKIAKDLSETPSFLTSSENPE